MKKTLTIFFLLLIVSYSYASTEYVILIKVMDNDDKGIIERSNGERWIIEKGVGAISFWRFEGKKILIYSPSLFCSVGSKIILPEVGQEARIWNAEQIHTESFPTLNTHLPKSATTEAELAVTALVYLEYYDPEMLEDHQTEVVLALKMFQKDNRLKQTGKLSAETQIALSQSIAACKPHTFESLNLAKLLLESANRLMSSTDNSDIPIILEDMIQIPDDEDFEDWEEELDYETD